MVTVFIKAGVAFCMFFSFTTFSGSFGESLSFNISGENKNRQCCPDGWIVFKESCYFIGRDLKTWREARSYCSSLQANLWTVNTIQEWETIRQFGIRYLWSWMGLYWKVQVPEWTDPSSLSIDSLPWLNKNSGSERGHTQGIDCVAIYSHPDPNSVYIHWYDCRLREYFICEANSTFESLSAAEQSKNSFINLNRHR